MFYHLNIGQGISPKLTQLALPPLYDKVVNSLPASNDTPPNDLTMATISRHLSGLAYVDRKKLGVVGNGIGGYLASR